MFSVFILPCIQLILMILSLTLKIYVISSTISLLFEFVQWNSVEPKVSHSIDIASLKDNFHTKLENAKTNYQPHTISTKTDVHKRLVPKHNIFTKFEHGKIFSKEAIDVPIKPGTAWTLHTTHPGKDHLWNKGILAKLKGRKMAK